VRPATLLKFHQDLVQRKYRRLFSSSPSPRRKPGPKGPSAELIAAIVALKGRNPHFGCVRIAQQITRVFGVEIDKDVVRRVHRAIAGLTPADSRSTRGIDSPRSQLRWADRLRATVAAQRMASPARRP
jgi:hypothetical protein